MYQPVLVLPHSTHRSLYIKPLSVPLFIRNYVHSMLYKVSSSWWNLPTSIELSFYAIGPSQQEILACCHNRRGLLKVHHWKVLQLNYVTMPIICISLLCYSTGAQALTHAAFGEGTGPIYLDNLECTSSETRLVDCLHTGFGVHNCAHSEDAGLRCQTPSSSYLLLYHVVMCSHHWNHDIATCIQQTNIWKSLLYLSFHNMGVTILA